MNEIEFAIAADEDIEEIVSVSIKSFHSDINVGANIFKGPPGYDSIEFHIEMLKKATCFFKMVLNEKIIGAFWFMKETNGSAYLYRIFVDPEFQNQGAGLKAFQFLFETFPGITKWSLKTPKWNKRTPNFYKKVGFEISAEDEKFKFFELK